MIQNRYAALAKCLQLEESPPQLELGKTAVPVILICQNYEFDTISIVANATAVAQSALSAALGAGTYQVSWVWSITFATPTLNSAVLVVERAGLSRLTLLHLIYNGSTAQQSLAGSVIVNVKDGENFRANVGALGAANEGRLTAVIQPL